MTRSRRARDAVSPSAATACYAPLQRESASRRSWLTVSSDQLLTLYPARFTVHQVLHAVSAVGKQLSTVHVDGVVALHAVRMNRLFNLPHDLAALPHQKYVPTRVRVAREDDRAPVSERQSLHNLRWLNEHQRIDTWLSRQTRAHNAAVQRPRAAA